MADQGSVLWSFKNINGQLEPQFKQQASQDAKDKITELLAILEEHPDVQKITTNLE